MYAAVAEADKKLPVNERRGTRPCFVDGRASTKTYIVVASKPDLSPEELGPGENLVKNMIGIRKLSDDEYRWHAYPNWAFFNLEKPVMARHSYHNTDYGYDSDILNKEHTEALIKILQGQRGLVLAPEEEALKVLDRGFKHEEDFADRAPHQR